jgi:2'-5' RNA ligase
MSGNRNSFLCIELPDLVIRALSGVVGDLQEKARACGCGFKAMEDASLHMTFVFLGEQLDGSKMPAGRVVGWHENLRQILNDCNHGADSKGLIQFAGLRLFPPGKQNLIVAIFKANKALHGLQHAFEQSAEDAGVKVQRQAINSEWVAHVTLGKIRANATDTARFGDQWIRDLNQPESTGFDFEAKRIVLCGHQPKQVYLNWVLNIEQNRTNHLDGDEEAAKWVQTPLQTEAEQLQEQLQLLLNTGPKYRSERQALKRRLHDLHQRSIRGGKFQYVRAERTPQISGIKPMLRGQRAEGCAPRRRKQAVAPSAHPTQGQIGLGMPLTNELSMLRLQPLAHEAAAFGCGRKYRCRNCQGGFFLGKEIFEDGGTQFCSGDCLWSWRLAQHDRAKRKTEAHKHEALLCGL